MSIRHKIYKKFVKISQTEEEALQSGSVGWEGQLIKGTPDWSKLFQLDKPALTAEEQAFLDGPAETLCAMINTQQVNADGDLPPEVWQYIKDQGFMGLEIDKKYGGLGFSSQAHSAIVTKIASRSIPAAVTVMVPNSLGPAELIAHYGTKQQQDYYLPRLAKGIDIPCFALTGPQAGSDAASMPDLGVVCKNDKGEIGIRLNWEKRYITLGPVATLIGLAFKLQDPDGLLGDKKDLGVTLAVIPRDTPGIKIGDRHRPMDLPFQNGPNFGENVFIPLDYIIGGKERAGQGWKMLMECLAVGRALSLPALSTAAAKLSSYATGAYTRVRRQFNTSISNFEGIEEPLARMAGLTYMMDAVRLATLQMVDQGQRPTIPSAILKYHLTENMRKIVNDAMDIHGGKAICNGPQNTFVDVYKGIPVAITVEGANIMTRNLIIFGQGLVRTHPYTLKIMAALKEENDRKGWRDLITSSAGFAANIVTHTVKSIVYGLTGKGGSAPVNDSKTKAYYKQINRLCSAFNSVSSVSLITLGNGLKQKERLSARMGDVYSHLYIASTVLWHFEKQGRPEVERPLVDWSVRYCLHEAEKALDQAISNYPKPLIGALLRPIAFPLGKKQKGPDDKLDRLAADTIREPGIIRDNLAKGIYVPKDKNEPLGVLAKAFDACVTTETIEKKISQAIKARTLKPNKNRTDLWATAVEGGVITRQDFSALLQREVLREAVIKVDSVQQYRDNSKPQA